MLLQLSQDLTPTFKHTKYLNNQCNILNVSIKTSKNKSTQRVNNTFEKGLTSPPPLLAFSLSLFILLFLHNFLSFSFEIRLFSALSASFHELTKTSSVMLPVHSLSSHPLPISPLPSFSISFMLFKFGVILYYKRDM